MLRPNLRRTLKPTLNNCMGGSSPPIAESFVARLNGDSQEWVFDDPIQIANEADVLLDLILGRNTTQVIYGGGSSPERFYIGTENGNWLVGNGTDRVATSVPAPLNTKVKTVVALSGGIFKFVVDGFVVYEQPIKYSASKSLSGISDLSGFRLYGAAFNFSIKSNGSLVNEIPLTKKSQGATQIATIGAVNATMINYTPDVWELENQPPQNTQQSSFQQAKAGEESEVEDGGWSGSAPITYTYQWQLDGVDIVGATAKTLLVIAGMIGQSLRCVVTATNQYGSGISITSAIVVTI